VRFLHSLLLLAALAAGGVAQAQQPADYRLHPGDQVEAAVWKEPDLTRTVIVRPDGKFTFPLAGEIVAAGRTVAQIQEDIASRLIKYIPEPVVTVSVTQIEGNRAYVIGQVNKPGAFVMNPSLTVLQALSLAGGTTPYASVNDIIIIRNSGGKSQSLPFRYSEISRGRNLEQNIRLESGDVVVVP
jgi:polysaccharide export outer membrane protein